MSGGGFGMMWLTKPVSYDAYWDDLRSGILAILSGNDEMLCYHRARSTTAPEDITSDTPLYMEGITMFT
jgi:hypothetical protein